MITRPLDLASKLRPEPRNFDFLFWVNGGLIVLFFMTWGSRFVLAPGLTENFRLPVIPTAREGAATTTHTISVRRGGLILTNDGALGLPQLRDWLKAAAKTTRQPRLLVIASSEVALGDIADIYAAADEAGFVGVVLAGVPSPAAPGAGK